MALDKLLSGAPARDVLVVDAGGRFSSADVEGRVRTVAAALKSLAAALDLIASGALPDQATSRRPQDAAGQ